MKYLIWGVSLFVAFFMGFYARELRVENHVDKPNNISSAPEPMYAHKDQKVKVNNDKPAEITDKTFVTTQIVNGVNASVDIKSKSAEELIIAIEQLLNKKEVIEVVDSAELHQLGNLVHSDPAALQYIIDHYMENVDTPLGDMLYRVFYFEPLQNSQTMDLLKLNLATGTREQRLGTLQILSAIGDSGQYIRSEVLNILLSSTDVDNQMTMAALSALDRDGPISSSEQPEVVDTLSSLLKDKNPNVRVTSLEKLGDWGKQSDAAFEGIIGALKDNNRKVRLAAIEVLASYGNGFPYENVRDIFVNTLQNPKEDREIRDKAFEALDSYTLDAKSYKYYENYAQNYNEREEVKNANLGAM